MHTFPGVAPIVVSTTYFDQYLDKVRNGQAFSMEGDEFGVAVANDFQKLQLKNPTGSGKNLVLVRAIFANLTATKWFVEPIVSPADATVGNQRTPQPRKFGQAAAVGLTGYNDTAIVPARSTLAAGRIAANERREVNLGVVLIPNSSILLSLQVPNITDVNLVGADWYEE